MPAWSSPAFLAAVACTLIAGAAASEWPQWRGPGGMGHSPERDLPLTWGGEGNANVRWKVALPKGDAAQSSPIVWQGRVFVTTALNTPVDHHVTCYRAEDGHLLWDALVPPGPWLLSDLRGGYACASPTTDGQRVYALFGSAVVVALDLDGRPLWRHELAPRAFDVAISSSPVLWQDTVLLLCDQTGGTSYLLALDAASGRERWRVQRPEQGFNHSTPVLLTNAGSTQLLVSASNRLQGIDPATGKPLWWCAHKGDVASPVFAGGVVYADDGRGGPGIAVDPTGSGDVGASHLRWSMKPGPNGLGSALAIGDHLYRYAIALRCITLATGKEVWSQRVGSGAFHASPIATADGRIYLASAGRSWVLQAGATFTLLGESDLGDAAACSPAVADGRMFLKGNRWLFCVGNRY